MITGWSADNVRGFELEVLKISAGGMPCSEKEQ